MTTRPKNLGCRERVLRAINFQNPDKIPLSYSVMPSALFKYGQSYIDLCKVYPSDFYDPGEVLKIPQRDVAHYRPDGSYYKEWTDEWGSVWVMLREGISGEVKRPVLDDWSKLKVLKVPPVPGILPADRQRRREGMKRQKEKYVGWSGGGSLFEQMQWLRGTEELLMDIAADCAEVYELADLLLEERLLPSIEVAIDAGADVVGFTDDWGTQQQLLINPESWRKIFKPCYRKMFNLVCQGGALPWLHSDGMTIAIIPDLIEIGLKVLNPQFSCMDMNTIRDLCDGRLCIAGDIDRQWTLPSGTPEQVREYLRQVTRVFDSPSGGFIYQLGLEDTPLENAEAAFHAIFEIRNLAPDKSLADGEAG